MEQETLFTVVYLATFQGAVIGTRYVVEYTKEFADQWSGGRLPTFIYALLWSWVILYGAGAILGQLGGGLWFADFFSGFVVAAAAGAMQKQTKPHQQG